MSESNPYRIDETGAPFVVDEECVDWDTGEHQEDSVDEFPGVAVEEWKDQEEETHQEEENRPEETDLYRATL